MAMKLPRVAYVDFETEEIQHRPEYPPKPVGVSIKKPGERKATYYAFGHDTENNCDRAAAKRALAEVWAGEYEVVFHNAKFDLDVAEVHMGLKLLPWERIHDTMWLLFLVDPHLKNLSLKPAAEVLLNMPPEERDAVRDWLVERKIAKRNQNDWGKHIARAPGKLVANYANGDVYRTEGLFKKLWPEVIARGMGAAYDRERKLLPILLRNEREGIRIDMELLRHDVEKVYIPALAKIESWLKKRLGDINFDSNEELADGLEAAGMAEGGFDTTPGGARSVNKKSLAGAVSDQKMLLALGYRSRLCTCLNMFMLPWLALGEQSGGVLQTTWHQTRQGGSGGNVGARSGRLITSDPNMLNLSKVWEGRNDGYTHPKFIQLPELPLVRRYVLPDKNAVWLHRDFNQQELRLLGHFENGLLMAAYQDNPWMDVHQFVKEKINELIGVDYERTQVKTNNFGLIYGEGVGSIAEKLKVPLPVVQQLRNAQMAAIPGFKELGKDLKALAKAGEPLHTWGGREYYCEPPKIIKGRMVSFEYKMLNYLIQPSAADCTKEALIRYDSVRENGRFLVTVYDEINISAPKGKAKREMAILREAMESIELDVPMLSDGKIGPRWGELEKYPEPKFNMEKWHAARTA